jgi:hypothetical protein
MMRRVIMSTKGVVEIKNKKTGEIKEYQTVALRVSEFRKAFPITDGWCISTNVVEMNEHHAFVRASIMHPDHGIVATGHAVEFWGDGYINKSSALENAETSAVGRALAAAGLGGEQYCTADELANAMVAQGSNASVSSWDSGEEKKEYPPPTVKVAMPVDEDEEAKILAGLRITASHYAERLFNIMGDEYTRWHDNMLRNVCGLEGEHISINDIVNVDALTVFVDGQKDKLKDLEE